MSKIIDCPTCKKTAVYGPENPYRPFCSERCQLIDLGEWAEENFRVPVTNVTPDLDEPEDMNSDEEFDGSQYGLH